MLTGLRDAGTTKGGADFFFKGVFQKEIVLVIAPLFKVCSKFFDLSETKIFCSQADQIFVDCPVLYLSWSLPQTYINLYLQINVRLHVDLGKDNKIYYRSLTARTFVNKLCSSINFKMLFQAVLINFVLLAIVPLSTSFSITAYKLTIYASVILLPLLFV